MTIQGKTIVFTGALSIPRHEAQRLVEEQGGTAGSSVTRKTDYVVAGKDPGSKLAKAGLVGIRILSEAEFFDLLKQEEVEEVPLPVEQFDYLQSHLVELTCKWCDRTYKQWDTLPNTGTCPVCELLSNPLCPHCGDNPTYVEDFGLYHCMLCGTWFEAPFSIHARKVKHLHIWVTRSVKGNRVTKKCVCGASIELARASEERGKQARMAAAPQLVQKRQQEATEREEQQRHQAWFDSLTDEHKQALLEQLSAGNLR